MNIWIMWNLPLDGVERETQERKSSSFLTLSVILSSNNKYTHVQCVGESGQLVYLSCAFVLLRCVDD